ncbi:MAG: hypothetical protein KJ064_07990 [Anaerolineae bacterium]|nr:hypothetical protein [Anaerolineae bacterium]
MEETDHQQSDAALLSTIPLPALAFCLLWWVFLNPAAYTRVKALPDPENCLHRAMNLLVSTLLISIPAIPLIGLVGKTVPLTQRMVDGGYIPQHWFIGLVGAWLVITCVSLFFTSKEALVMALNGVLSIALATVFLAAVALTNNGGKLIMILVATLLAAFFVAFEDNLLLSSGNHWITQSLFGLLAALTMIVMIVFSIWSTGLVLVNAYFAATGMNHAVSKQKPNGITKMVFAALPVVYAALIWIYWFGGWQALGS